MTMWTSLTPSPSPRGEGRKFPLLLGEELRGEVPSSLSPGEGLG